MERPRSVVYCHVECSHVILSEAKNLAYHTEILRFAQNDMADGACYSSSWRGDAGRQRDAMQIIEERSDDGMHVVQMAIRSQSERTEILVGDTAGTTRVVEELALQRLLRVYEQVEIDDVAVQFLPPTSPEQRCHCAMYIEANCQRSRWPRYDELSMEALIESSIAPPLVELFGAASIEAIRIISVS